MKRGKALLIAALAALALAALVRFFFVGYGMTALCLAGLSACLFFFGLMRRRGTRAAKILSIIALGLIAVGAGLFLTAEIPIIADARPDEDTDADYAIVFGAAVHGTEPSLSLTERLDAALSWLEEHPDAKAVVSGGQGRYEDLPEGRLMYEWLVAHGVAPERLIMEDRAENSYQNLLNSLAMIEADGGDPTGRVALISSEYHLHRLRYMAERLGCEPVLVAAHTGHFTLMVNYAVREAAAMWKCRILGME